MKTRMIHITGDSKFGGGGIVIMDIARAAAAEGYDVSVLTTDPVFREKLHGQGTPTVEIDVIRRPIRPVWDFLGMVRLWRYLRKERYDIVHTHTSKAGFVGRLAARLAGVRIVVHTVHGFAFHEQSGTAAKKVYIVLERLAGHACNLLVTVSEYHRAAAQQLGIGRPGRLIAIPNGIDPNRVAPTNTRDEVRAELGLRPDEIALMTIGRLADQKGIEFALEALSLMEPDLRQNIRLILAGVGPLADYLAGKAVELGVDNVVDFLGFRDDVGNLLAAGDIVLLPSLWEGLSITLLEAMAAEKPIVATTIPTNVEATRDGSCAVLVPAKDSVALARAISMVAADQQIREDLGRRAGEIFRESYSTDRMVTAYLNQYQRLLEESPQRF